MSARALYPTPESMADPETAMTDPRAFQVQPGPVGAQVLAQPPAPQALAQPVAESPWTDERKAFAAQANAAGRNYQKAVEQRRALRQGQRDYSKIKNQLDASASSLSDLKHMQDTYKDIYTPDSPATMALTKQQIHHFEKVQRLREQLTQKAQHLNQRFGLKLDKHGGLADESMGDDGNDEFDRMIQEGHTDAMMAQPPGMAYPPGMVYPP